LGVSYQLYTKADIHFNLFYFWDNLSPIAHIITAINPNITVIIVSNPIIQIIGPSP
jgi:hypothetical protein